ncbi:uncharacterized protein [Triticum aestivum]|uniref:uncharacterized protein n=1 Tax=Triticum aestivum TaxID=4565 RepID=UPI001D010A56|nr:uncharacterized protein LOC123057280 [Triticum aestivum]
MNVVKCHDRFFCKATGVASNACKAARVGCSVFLVLPRWKKLELGFFFSPAEAQAGELRVAARAGPPGKSSNLQQKKLEVEDELEFQARLELQVQALETQARAGPVRRRRRPWAARGIAAQPWAAGGDSDAALGGGRDRGGRGWRRGSALQQWSRRPSRWSPRRSRWTARRSSPPCGRCSSPPCGRRSSPRAAQVGRGGGGSQRWRRPWPLSRARPYGGCRRWREGPQCAPATEKGGRSSGV